MELSTGTLALLGSIALVLTAVCVKRPHLGLGIWILMLIPAPLFPGADFDWLFYGFAGFTFVVLLGWLINLSRRAAPFRSVANSDKIGTILKAWLVLCLIGLPLSLIFNPGSFSERMSFYIRAAAPYLYLLVFFVVRALPFTTRQVQHILNCLLAVATAFALITFAIYAVTGQRVSGLYTPLAFPFAVLGGNLTFTRMLVAEGRRAVFGWGLLTGVFALAMILTFTKAQIIAMVISLAFIAFLVSRRRSHGTARRIMGLAAGLALSSTALTALASAQTASDLSFSEMVTVRLNDESSAGTRRAEWQAALQQFAESPVFGKGIGHQVERDVMGESLTASYVHNQIAYIAMTMGVAGLIVYMMLVYNWARLVSSFGQVRADLVGPLAATHGCVLTLGVYALMFATFGIIQHNLLLGVFLGLAVLMTPGTDASHPSRQTGNPISTQ